MKNGSNIKTYYLWWLNTKTNKRFFAGSGFYNDKTGDYSLIINLLEQGHEAKRNSELFLRPIKVLNNNTYYRLEKLINNKNKSNRVSIGEGWKNKETLGDIFINIEPLTNFRKKLVLTIPNQEKSEHE